MQVIPFGSEYDQRFSTQLGDGNYTFGCRWNERGKRWSFDLTRDTDQLKLLAGAAMLIGEDLLAPYAFGIGGLVLTDLSRKTTDAGPEDLGSRVVATWFSPDELAILKAALRAAGLPDVIIAGGIAPAGAIPGAGVVGNGGGGSSGTGTGGGTTIIQATSTSNIFNVTGGLGFAQYSELSDGSGNEVLMGRFVQLPGLNPNPTVGLTVGILASGGGTVRVYTGGTFEAIGSTGTPSGSLRGSAVVSGADAPYQITSGAFSNPGGMLAVKVTIQASAPPDPVGVAYIGGVLA